MRVLVFSWFYPPIIGGVEVIAKRTVELLINLGFEVDLLTLKESNLQNTLMITVSNVTENGHYRIYSGDCQCWLDTQNYFKYQLVYAHNLLLPIELTISKALLNFCTQSRVPLIEHSHTIPRFSTLYKAFSKVEFTRLITVSRFLRDCFIKINYKASNEWLEKTHIQTIYNPIDLQTFRLDNELRNACRTELGVNDLEPLILFPSRIFDIDGSLSLAKNAPLALEAFSHYIRLLGHGTLLLLAPPGFFNLNRQEESIKELREMAARWGVQERVRILRKRLSAQEMVQYYNAADLSIIPSKESFCLSAAESVICGTPIVGLAFGGLMEVLTVKGHVGLVIPGQNLAKRLGQQMATILNDRSIIEQITKEGREHVLSICDSKLWNDRIRETIMELLKISVNG